MEYTGSGKVGKDGPVYVILVNYGNWQDTSECLRSLELHAQIEVNVIVVDIEDRNGSRKELQDAMAPLTRNRYRLLGQRTNLGFAHACNEGIRTALGESLACFIWLLNNDTLVGPGSLSGLIQCRRKAMIDSGRKPGFIGSVITDHPGGDRIQYAGGGINAAKASLTVTGEGASLAVYPLHGRYSETEWVMGASMFFHSSLLDSIGFMPEDYFLYYEDVDWSLQAIRKGHVNLVSHESVIVHKQGSSTGQDYNAGKRVNPDTTWHFYNSYLLFFKRNYPSKYLVAKAVLFKQMAGKLARGDLGRFRIIMKVLFGMGRSRKA